MRLLFIFLLYLPVISNSGETYTQIISTENQAPSKIKQMIISGFQLLSKKQHNDYNSGNYTCQTPINCEEDDHNNVFIQLADYYSQDTNGKDLKLNIKHFSKNNMTYMMADIDIIE